MWIKYCGQRYWEKFRTWKQCESMMLPMTHFTQDGNFLNNVSLYFSQCSFIHPDKWNFASRGQISKNSRSCHFVCSAKFIAFEGESVTFSSRSIWISKTFLVNTWCISVGMTSSLSKVETKHDLGNEVWLHLLHQFYKEMLLIDFSSRVLCHIIKMMNIDDICSCTFSAEMSRISCQSLRSGERMVIGVIVIHEIVSK